MPPKKAIKKKTASGYKMPDPIPAGMHEMKFNKHSIKVGENQLIQSYRKGKNNPKSSQSYFVFSFQAK